MASSLLHFSSSSFFLSKANQGGAMNYKIQMTFLAVNGAGTQTKQNKNIPLKVEGIRAFLNRREVGGLGSFILVLYGYRHFGRQVAIGADLPRQEPPRLCDAACEKQLENVPMITTDSGLQYKDIEIGTGPSPPIGFQVAADYVAMVPSGKVFDSSLEKGRPYIFRVGSGQVIKGLDEGILSMKVGGKRRLYIPGPVSF
eukprot:c13863_g1_i1 orf=843-1439(-)